jgi:hypothetical protein
MVGDISADPVTQGTNAVMEEEHVVLPALPPVLQFPPLELELLLEQAMTVAKTATTATAASVPMDRSMLKESFRGLTLAEACGPGAAGPTARRAARPVRGRGVHEAHLRRARPVRA